MAESAPTLKWKKRGQVLVCGEYTITKDHTLHFPFRLYGTHGMLLYGTKLEQMQGFARVHYEAQLKAAAGSV